MMMSAVTVGLAAVLVLISWHDLRAFRVPDLLSLPLAAAGLAVVLIQPDVTLLSRVSGLVIGFLCLAIPGEIHFRRTGIEALGLGDAKLFAAAGAWLGVAALPLVLLLASTTGLAAALLLGWTQTGRNIPFAPFLCGAFGAVWLFRLAGLES